MSENAPENTPDNENDADETRDESRERESHDERNNDERRERNERQTGEDNDKSHDESRRRTDWKSEARKWEKRAKANDDAAKRLAELERANESDSQRLERERDEARSAAEASNVELARLRAGVRYGLTEDDLELLGTGTPDEIDDRAKRLADRLGSAAKKPPTSRRPSERLSGGNEPEREPEETDLRKLGARMFQH